MAGCSSPSRPPAWAEDSVVIISVEVAEAPQPVLFFESSILPKPKIVTHGGTGFGLCGAQTCRIYTCAHVVAGAKAIYVTLRNGKVQWGKLLKSDEQSDLAELEIGDMPPSLALRRFPPIPLEKIWQIGNPGDLRFIITNGFFITFSGENLFVIDTFFGNSGSPLMDGAGRVVGMTHDAVPGTRFTGGGTLQDLQNFVHPESPR